MEQVISDLSMGTVGDRGTRGDIAQRGAEKHVGDIAQRGAAARETESQRGFVPLPESATWGVTKRGWNSSSCMLELCP